MLLLFFYFIIIIKIAEWRLYRSTQCQTIGGVDWREEGGVIKLRGGELYLEMRTIKFVPRGEDVGIEGRCLRVRSADSVVGPTLK